MSDREESHGSGVIETRQGEKIPVFYHMLVEQQSVEAGPDQVTISGRLSITGDPWLERTVIKDGHVLVLQDGQRLRVRVKPAGRGSMTLPFKAIPLQEARPAS